MDVLSLWTFSLTLQIRKSYVAVCVGNPGEGATIDVPIGRHPNRRQRMVAVPTIQPNIRARRAVSVVSTAAFDGKLSVAEVSIETGRTHQIRVHLQVRVGGTDGASFEVTFCLFGKTRAVPNQAQQHRILVATQCPQFCRQSIPRSFRYCSLMAFANFAFSNSKPPFYRCGCNKHSLKTTGLSVTSQCDPNCFVLTSNPSAFSAPTHARPRRRCVREQGLEPETGAEHGDDSPPLARTLARVQASGYGGACIAGRAAARRRGVGGEENIPPGTTWMDTTPLL